MIAMDERLYTADEVANLFNMHPVSIRRMVSQGRMKCFRVGKSVRFTQEHIEAFIDSSDSHQTKETGDHMEGLRIVNRKSGYSRHVESKKISGNFRREDEKWGRLYVSFAHDFYNAMPDGMETRFQLAVSEKDELVLVESDEGIKITYAGGKDQRQDDAARKSVTIKNIDLADIPSKYIPVNGSKIHLTGKEGEFHGAMIIALNIENVQ